MSGFRFAITLLLDSTFHCSSNGLTAEITRAVTTQAENNGPRFGVGLIERLGGFHESI